MSSIFIYYIYIKAVVQGFGGGGRQRIHIRNIHFLMPFCRYAIVHTNHHFARKRESTAMVILLTFFFNWWGKRMRAKGF